MLACLLNVQADDHLLRRDPPRAWREARRGSASAAAGRAAPRRAALGGTLVLVQRRGRRLRLQTLFGFLDRILDLRKVDLIKSR